MTYLSYNPLVETIADDEAETFQKIADTFADMGRKVAETEGKAVRVSHAKATALLNGTLTVADGLPAELAQGLAAAPGRYDAVIRFAQGPGEMLHDRVSTHRGMAVRVTGLPGDVIPESDELGTQDFVLEAHSKAFINSTATTFLANLSGGVSNAPSLPEGVKNAVSAFSRVTEAGLEAVGLEAKTLGFFGHPKVHPLVEAYFSQAPMRWGDHVAKVGFYPTAATLAGLPADELDTEDFDTFRNAMMAHFASAGAEFELRVQLAQDDGSTPIEDASVEWPEEGNPYRTVARLTIAPQPAWTPERDDEFARLSFRPANSLAAHRPLGQVMRARLYVYGQLADWRRAANGEAAARPGAEMLPA